MKSPFTHPPNPRPRVMVANAASAVKMVGTRRKRFDDAYFFLLEGSWGRLLLIVLCLFLVLNLTFGGLFWATGGIAGMQTGSFWEYFFFSIQTTATIGYGGMHPITTLANTLVAIEAFLGLLQAALVTGLVFAKFARPTARVRFSKVAVVAPMDGVPTLMFRMANERLNFVVDATLKVTLLRFETTQEGTRIRKFVDVPLVRSTSPTFLLTWTALHPITENSPLFGISPEQFVASGTEILLTLSGLDAVLMQTVHARYSYFSDEVRWGHAFADVIAPELVDGKRVLDMTKFDETRRLDAPVRAANS